jgi:hypothetical protein
MLLTSEYASVAYPATDPGKSAVRRLELYSARIKAAESAGKGFRSHLWLRIGWLVAESNLRPPDEQAAIIAGLDDQLARLNRRNGGVVDDRD